MLLTSRFLVNVIGEEVHRPIAPVGKWTEEGSNGDSAKSLRRAGKRGQSFLMGSGMAVGVLCTDCPLLLPLPDEHGLRQGWVGTR